MSLPDDIKNVKNEENMKCINEKDGWYELENNNYDILVDIEEYLAKEDESLETLLNPSEPTIRVKVLGK